MDERSRKSELQKSGATPSSPANRNGFKLWRRHARWLVPAVWIGMVYGFHQGTFQTITQSRDELQGEDMDAPFSPQSSWHVHLHEDDGASDDGGDDTGHADLLRKPSSSMMSSSSSSLTGSSKQISQQQISLPSCNRRCEDHPHKIYYLYHPTQGAGLRDRGTKFHRLLNIAGFLCATVHAVKPHLLLSAEHNQNQSISPRLSWDDFWNFTFVGTDGEKSFFDVNALPSSDQLRNTSKSMRHSLAATSMAISSESAPRLLDYKRWYEHDDARTGRWNTTFLVTSDAKKVIESFNAAERISFQSDKHEHEHQQPRHRFVWFITANYYHMRHKLQKSFQKRVSNPDHPFYDPYYKQGALDLPLDDVHCPYYNDGRTKIPNLMQEVIDSIQNDIWSGGRAENRAADGTNDLGDVSREYEGDQHNSRTERHERQSQHKYDTKPKLIFFHIRRADTQDQCNTTLPRVHSFLNCTFGIEVKNDGTAHVPSAKRVIAPVSNHPPVVVLFASDERDETYREAVLRMLNENPHVRSAYDVDALVWAHMREVLLRHHDAKEHLMNNMYRFGILLNLQIATADGSIQLRRTYCEDCVPNFLEDLYGHEDGRYRLVHP